jgi:hypothetical protein
MSVAEGGAVAVGVVAEPPAGTVSTGVVAVGVGAVVVPAGPPGSWTTTVPVIPTWWSHMNEYVPARVNVHIPAQLPAVGELGNCKALDDEPPTVC